MHGKGRRTPTDSKERTSAGTYLKPNKDKTGICGSLLALQPLPTCPKDKMSRYHSVVASLFVALAVVALTSAASVGKSADDKFTVTNPAGGRWHGHLSEFNDDVIAWKGIQYV